MIKNALRVWLERRQRERAIFDRSVGALPRFEAFLTERADQFGVDPLTERRVFVVACGENDVSVTFVEGHVLKVGVDPQRGVTVESGKRFERYIGLDFENDACQLIGPNGDPSTTRTFSGTWDLWVESLLR